MSLWTKRLLLLLIAAGIALSWWLLRQKPAAEAGGAPAVTQAAAGREPLYWYDPMKPEVHFDKPGKSPYMDMALQPKYADGAAPGGTPTVSVDPRTMQNLGVRTAVVERASLSGVIDAVGIVTVDERRITSVQARAAGWIEKLNVRAVGDLVRRGEAVASIYSPDLYSSRSELALAQKSGDPQLVAAAQERLRLLGASVGAGPRTAVLAPANGVVTELGVREGAQVSPGMTLMQLADLSRIWIVAQVPEAQAGALQAGTSATAKLAGQAAELQGEIEYVYPTADATTRTVTARIAFDNPDGALKPGQYASVRLQAGGGAQVLTVPTEAVIRTGGGARVIVALGDGKFEPRAVIVGGESGDRTAILSGLRHGETVVASGQFLIDSEANLQGALARLVPPAAPEAASPGAAPPSADRSQREMPR